MNLVGTSGNDSLVGGPDDDTLDGGGGSDTLNGAGGNDRYYVTAGDVIQDSGGNDTIYAAASFALPSAIENIVYLGSANTASVGNWQANAMTGNAGNNYMEGRDGNDTLTGGAGTDTLVGGSGADVFRFIDATPDNVTDFASGTDKIVLDAPLFTSIDHVVYNAATGQLWYDADGDGSGAAQLIATLTNRPALSTADIRVEGGGTPPPPPPPGDGVIRGTSGDDSLTGTSGNDSMEGLAGNDTLNGGAGADTMAGGLHDDVYIVDDAGDVVIELEGGGSNDEVRSAVSYALPDWTNHLTLTGTAAIDGTGTELENVLTGNGGANVLNGRGGADTLTGGAGADTFVLDQAPGVAHADALTDFNYEQDSIVLDGAVLANLGPSGRFAVGDGRFYSNVGATSGRDIDDRIVYNVSTGELFYDPDGSGAATGQLIATLSGPRALQPANFVVINSSGTLDAHITGTAGNDSLLGGDGHDTIEGLGGNDTLYGNPGDDVLDGGAGQDILNGADGADTLLGGDGHDTLNGSGGGADTLDGGLGDDFFYLDDLDSYTDAGGTDTIWVGGRDWALASFIENGYIGFGATLTLLGNDLNNSLYGHSWHSRIEGAGGNDFVDAAQGDDTVIGGAGNDALLGREGRDVLDGGAGNDTLDGGLDDDSVYGGTGTDALTGGAGADAFLFDQASGAHADLVSDFLSGTDGLVLDGAGLAAIGPSGGFSPGDARFWAATGATSGHDADDRIVYNTLTGDLFYDADGSGTAAAQRIATLQGAPSVAATDITVVNGNNGSAIVGTNGNDTLTGTAGADTIEGFGGDDSLVGLAGDDLLRGGTGNDVLNGGAGADTLEGGEGHDSYVVTGSNDVIVDAGGIDTVIGTRFGTMDEGIDHWALQGSWDPTFIWPEVTGNGLNNYISNNTDLHAMLDGGGGNDTLMGGNGHDVFFFSGASGDYGNDVVDGRWGDTDGLDFEWHAASAVVIDFRAGTVTGGGTGGAGSVSFIDIERAIGTPFDDRLTADDLGRSLEGYGGNDTLTGGAGHDYLGGGGIWADHPPGDPDGDDEIRGGAGNDTLAGEEGDDFLDGGSGDDHFWLSSWFDNQGNDTVLGGDGVDSVVSAAGGVADLVAGTLTTSFGVTVLSGIENFSVHVGDVRIIGTSGDNVLGGGDGHDTIEAGAGNDTVYGDDIGRSLLPPIDFADLLMGEDGHDLLVGRWGNDTLHGGNGSDTLYGGVGPDDGSNTAGDGDDTLDGGAGNDRMVGSVGSDSFLFSITPGGINSDRIEGFASGTDRIVLDGTAHANSGPAGDFAAGDGRFREGSSALDADDRVIYNPVNGQLFYDADGSGAGTAQLMATLEGAPTVVATDIAVVNGSSGGGTVVRGTQGSDSLTGTSGNDSMEGLAGNDTLDGGAGADTMDGGLHDDVFIVDHAGDTVIELEGGGSNDEVRSSVTFTLPAWVNGLVLTGTVAIDGSGNELENVITGNAAANWLRGLDGDDVLDGAGGRDSLDGGAGNDTLIGGDNDESQPQTLNGGSGADSMVGGTGSDVFFVDEAADAFSDAGGFDAVFSSVSVVTPDWLEQVALLGTANASITGNAFNNNLYGNDGANTVTGLAGSDWVAGGGGNDTLSGGSGFDRLTGDAGSDVFAFDSAPGNVNADSILDFSSGQGDLIRLDAGEMGALGASGRFASADARFRAGASAQDADDRVVYNPASGQLWYDADGSGSGSAQLIAVLAGAPSLAATDITVVNGTASPPSNVITGTSGPDTLVGTAGDDSYYVTPGDVIQDPGGMDQLFAETSFALPSAIEHITYLGTANTASAGNWRANTMTGNSGNNFLDGRDGNDTLYGAEGNDTLQGRTGADSFVFGEMGAANADSVMDFSSGTDRIAFDDSVFSGIDAAGSFRAGAGVSSGQDADDRVLYNTSTGQLYYDADGSGAGASQLVATLANAPGLAASDISLI